MKYIIIIIIIIIIIFNCYNINEKFKSDIVSNTVYDNNSHYSPYMSTDDPHEIKYTTDLELGTTYHDNIKCCLIEKKYVESKNNNSLYNGKFIYDYKKLRDDKCTPQLYNLDSNKQLFIEGDNNWSNFFCRPISEESYKPKNKLLGSCRNMNKECIDFVNKDFCDKRKMVWSNLTCHDNLPYVWSEKTDRVNRNIKETNKSKNTFKMF